MAVSESIDFGSSLRAAREGRGLTLRDISERTKISKSVLDALEKSDVSCLPAGLFGRSFVRSFAAEVGLEPEATVEVFLDSFPEYRPEDIKKLQDSPSEYESVANREGCAVTPVRLALLGVLLIVLVFLFFVLTNDDPNVESLVPPVVKESVVVPQEPSQSLSEAASDGLLTIEVYPNSSCWMTVTLDGQQVFVGVLESDDRRTYQAKDRIILDIGNSAAFEFSINQRPGRSLGTVGQVVSLDITWDNYLSFVAR